MSTNRQKTVAIVHFNTPELTEACIRSIRRHGGRDYRIVVFDNSDKRPFPKTKDVEIFDNTQGQIFNFEQEIAKYPNRDLAVGGVNNWGSDKHTMSVQALWDLLPEGFMLIDSDVLIKESFDLMFQWNECCCGYVSKQNTHPRLMPMLLWINVPMCKAGGARFYDPARSWALNRGNRWDTGAAFYDDIRRLKPQCHGKAISRDVILRMIEHYKQGSWGRCDIRQQAKWLIDHADLWEPTPREKGIKDVAICAIGRNENRYAVEWVEHYKRLGVKKIFIYDNWRTGDEEKLADVLQPYVKSGLVEITDCHDRDRYQVLAYDDCYRKHGRDFAWIGFLDFDEFLRYDGKKKIATMFANYDADCVLVNWRLFTDNGLVHYDPRPLAERFTEPMPKDKPVKYSWPENKHIKSFIRGGLHNFKFASPHVAKTPLKCINPSGKPVKQQAFTEIDWSVMHLDHYWTKTAEEWMNVKLSRGYPSPTTYLDKFMQKQAEYFFNVNERTTEKEAIVCGHPEKG